MRMNVSVGGIPVKTLLDSGANRVVLGDPGWERIRTLGLAEVRSGPRALTLADGSTVECLGEVTLPIQLETKIKYFKVLIVPAVKHSLILGLNFWYRMGVVPNVRRGTWEFAREDETVGRVGTVCELVDGKEEECEKERLREIVDQYFRDVGEDELGFTNLVQHRIEVNEGVTPIRSRSYPVSPYIQEKIDQELDSMLEMGVIERSQSEWSSPVLMIPKKDGTYRFVVDYRKVNAVSRRSAYPLPNISSILSKLGNSRYLSSLDI